jgi:hypothetical protein
MTKDEILSMAREAGATPYTNRHYPDRQTNTFNPEQLGRFAALVAEKATEQANARQNTSWALMCKKMVAAEREACAKVCDDLPAPEVYSDTDKSMWDVTCVDCAEAIRARGQK